MSYSSSTWTPPDLGEACAVYTTITTCQPQTFLFLQLVASLFGRSKDDVSSYSSPVFSSNINNNFHSFVKRSTDFGFDFNQEFDQFFDQQLPAPNFPSFPNSDHNQQDNAPPIRQEYDFIIAGAGSAGCVLANRLSEVPHWKVLLLEAGGEEPEVAEVPAFATMLQRSSIDWAFMTQPSPHSCLARRNGQCAWVRGRVMGGSSTVNYLIYNRGHPHDYDEWSEMGNIGWSYREVLPYFIKSENNHNPDKIEPYYHGVDGPLDVEIFPYQDKNTLALLEAYQELGLPILDQSADRLIGASLLQHTSKNGRRVSANVAYIRPIRRKRKNLVIQTNAFVTRVLINPKTKTAYGVEYTRNGKLIQAVARKEVIVSCGALMTPRVLMTSGIGPADELHQHGIELIKELAVGYNLQDHTTLDGVVFILTNKTVTDVDQQQRENDVYYYKDHQRGPLSATGTVQVNAFVQTKFENEHDRPDIQIAIDTTNVHDVVTDPVLAAETKVTPLSYYNALMIRPILLNPKSRGVVKLNDSDPIYGYPLVHANTFFVDIDLQRFVEGIKQSLNLLKTHTLQHLGYRLLSTPLPNCQHVAFGSDEYWACAATSYTGTIYHMSGTCKMGPKDDNQAVVDPELRVYGIKNLRVIDASIMPKIIRGNTNAPTIMIAEKGSDMIKARWLKQNDYFYHNGNGNANDDIFLNK